MAFSSARLPAGVLRIVAAPVLSHRIIRNYAAIADGVTPELKGAERDRIILSSESYERGMV